MARESSEISLQLQALQNTQPIISAPYQHLVQVDRSALPPHLLQTQPPTGATSDYSHHQHGCMGPSHPSTGLAEPSNPVQVFTVPAQTAPLSGAPRPGEAREE